MTKSRDTPAPDARRATVTLSPQRMRQQRSVTAGTPEHWRPKTRGDCVSAPRPCPYVGCKYHLATDVLPDGSLRLAFGEDVEALSEMQETCALDVADRGEKDVTLDYLAELSNLTRERVRQMEVAAMGRLRSGLVTPDGD